MNEPQPQEAAPGAEPGGQLESRKEAARREVLEYLGESAEVAPEEAEQIRREWQE